MAKEVIDIGIAPEEAVMGGMGIVLMEGHQALHIGGVQVLITVVPTAPPMIGTMLQCMTGVGAPIMEGMRALNMLEDTAVAPLFEDEELEAICCRSGLSMMLRPGGGFPISFRYIL